MSKRITVVGSTKENGELKRLSTSICYNKITLPNYEFDERDTIFCPVDMMIETSQLVSFETATTPSLLEGILSLIYRLPKQKLKGLIAFSSAYFINSKAACFLSTLPCCYTPHTVTAKPPT
mgnify:CR=1 FL=1